MKTRPITTLFIDVGGVLLTNGWDHDSRKLAAKQYHLDFKDLEARHQMIFDTYELGKLNLKEYLDYVVFYQKRQFMRGQFQQFMLDQSQPYPQMIGMVRQLKMQYKLKVAVVSNEARELNAYRIKRFKLDSFVDFFISSSIVHLRKPDPEIFQLALDIAQISASQAVFIDDRALFVEIAENMGMRGICHEDYNTTCDKLALLGLNCDKRL